MANTTHNLKTWPEHFKELRSGAKTFEVRLNDRDYKVGDTLNLEEYDPKTQSYTGEETERKVTHILLGGLFGIKPNYVVMSISETDNQDRKKLGEEAIGLMVKLLPPHDYGENYDAAALQDVICELSGYNFESKNV